VSGERAGFTFDADLSMGDANSFPPTSELSERVRSAPTEQLDVWLTRILTADSIEQVFDPS
jgi:hypothetical protein